MAPEILQDAEVSPEEHSERRHKYVAVPLDFITRVDRHIELEEENQRKHEETFAKGDIRMTTIEGEIKSIAVANRASNETSTRYMKFVSILAGALISLSLWIVKAQHEDISTILQDMKTMQSADAVKREQFGETLGVVRMLVEKTNHHQTEIDRLNGRMMPHDKAVVKGK